MEQVPTCDVDEDYHLLIPSRFPPVPLYTRLGDDDVQAAAEQAEAKTNPRIREEARLAAASKVEAEHQLQNWNLAPFAYANPAGTTFLGPQHRVLEMIAGEWAALAHAVLRREAFLADTDEPPVRVEMRLLKRRVTGRFADLKGAALDPDAEGRRRLGEQIYGSDARGIAFRRADLGGAAAVAVFDGGVLGRVMQSDHYRFDWNGQQITRIGNLSTHEVIERETLFSELARRAAA